MQRIFIDHLLIPFLNIIIKYKFIIAILLD